MCQRTIRKYHHPSVISYPSSCPIKSAVAHWARVSSRRLWRREFEQSYLSFIGRPVIVVMLCVKRDVFVISLISSATELYNYLIHNLEGAEKFWAHAHVMEGNALDQNYRLQNEWPSNIVHGMPNAHTTILSPQERLVIEMALVKKEPRQLYLSYGPRTSLEVLFMATFRLAFFSKMDGRAGWKIPSLCVMSYSEAGYWGGSFQQWPSKSLWKLSVGWIW